MPNNELDTMLRQAGAGDLAGQMDDLPPPPAARPKGAAPKASGEDPGAEGGDDGRGEGAVDVDLLEEMGFIERPAGDDEGDDEGSETEPDLDEDEEGAAKPRSREAVLSRENARLYKILDQVLQRRDGGVRSDVDEGSGDEALQLPSFTFDTAGLKAPAGVDESEFKDEVEATAPIVGAALNQFVKQFFTPLMQQMGVLANVVGDMHLSKKLPGWEDPTIKPVRDKIYAQLPPGMRSALNNESGAALLTLAAQGALKAKAGKQEDKRLTQRRGMVEGAGGVPARVAPDDNKRNARLQHFVRTATDDKFLAMLNGVEERGYRR